MSVVGFDFGNANGVVAVARQRGIDVVLNDEFKCETPTIICFGEKQMFIGTAGAATMMTNPQNSISQIKRLIGRPFFDPELQRDIKGLPFAVTEGPDGFPLIHARYLGEQRSFSPTEIMGMVLSNLKGIAEKNLNAAVVDCCIGIPSYFTDLQRRAVMDAASIAGLHPLSLMHETTSTALAYGIYKTDLPENDQINVAFVDIGHSSMQVCITGFKKGQLKVLAHSFDRCLGGRDFDEVLFNHFAVKFKDEYKIDVFQNARACIMLRAGCEKLKKVLSTNLEAPLNIECLMEDKDVRGFIKREEFELISAPILERVKKPLEKALAEAGLSVDNFHSVEVVGSGSRVPAILKILTDFFGKEPRRTMNASECVSKGCVLQCAILSSTFRVREFRVNESFPFPIALSWKGSAGASESQQSTIVFPKGNPIPSTKALTFYRAGTFTLDVLYADVSKLQAPAKISTYTIGPFQSPTGERSKLKVKVRLNLHGIVSVESATLLEEEELDIPVSKEATKMETDEAANNTASSVASKADVKMQDAKSASKSQGVENGVPESGEKPVQMETDVKPKAPKKKLKKTSIPVSETVYGSLSHTNLQKADEKEFEMALQDQVTEETKDCKNAVQAYVYGIRSKLNDKYEDFVTPADKEAFSGKLQEVEDWLYEDGEDETKAVYKAKLEELTTEYVVENYEHSLAQLIAYGGKLKSEVQRARAQWAEAVCRAEKAEKDAGESVELRARVDTMVAQLAHAREVEGAQRKIHEKASQEASLLRDEVSRLTEELRGAREAGKKVEKVAQQKEQEAQMREAEAKGAKAMVEDELARLRAENGMLIENLEKAQKELERSSVGSDQLAVQDLERTRQKVEVLRRDLEAEVKKWQSEELRGIDLESQLFLFRDRVNRYKLAASDHEQKAIALEEKLGTLQVVANTQILRVVVYVRDRVERLCRQAGVSLDLSSLEPRRVAEESGARAALMASSLTSEGLPDVSVACGAAAPRLGWVG